MITRKQFFPLFAVMVVLASSACEGKLTLKTECGETCPIIESIEPAVAPAGTTVRIQGNHFSSENKFYFGTTLAEASILSKQEVTAVVPEGIDYRSTVMVQLVAYLAPGPDFYFTGTEERPVTSMSPELICEGIQYLDLQGELQEGTRVCRSPSCSGEGEVGCETTDLLVSASVTGLEEKVVAGNTVAGVEGTVTLPTSTDVVAGVAYGVAGSETQGAFTIPNSSDVVAGVAYGVGSSLVGSAVTGALANCNTDGATGCTATSTYPAASVCTADDSNCYLAAYVATTQPYKAINYDDINTNKAAIRSSYTISGIAGTLADCAAAGATGCYADTGFPVINASQATVATNLTSSNFDSTIATAGNFEFWGVDGTRYQVAGDSDLVNTNLRTGVEIHGITGNMVETPADCAADGSQNCVATGLYTAATACTADDSDCYLAPYVATTQPYKAINYDDINTNKAAIRSSYTISGIAGTLADCAAAGATGCYADTGFPVINSSEATVATDLTSGNFDSTIATAGNFEFWGVDGTRYQVAGDSDLVNTNLRTGVEIHGITGNMVETPADCAADGSQNCVATGLYTAATACTADDSDCYLAPYVATTQPYKAIDYDDIDTNKASIRSSYTISGIAGTMGNCASAGSQSCYATGTYFASEACSSDGDTDCMVDNGTNYLAAATGSVAAGNIKRGLQIAGVTGNFPSSTSPLPRYSDSGSTTNTTGSDEADLDLATFNAKVKSNTAFEYWDSNGQRHEDTGDSDITPANYRSSASIFGVSGSIADCSADGSTGCYTVASYPSVDTTALTVWDIKTGKTAGGISGSVKTNCRNRANSTIYDSDTDPVGNSGTTAGSTLHWWDTIDNYDNNANTLPTEQPAGWTTDHACGNELWSDVTGGDGCNAAGDDCMMQDNVSGLIWSEGEPVTGVAPGDTADTWENGVKQCNDLTFGGQSDWRLPTQMELMQAYSHGIRQLGYKGGTSNDGSDNNQNFIADVDQYFWSASTQSDSTGLAWRVYLHVGITNNYFKTDSFRVVCVRP